MALVNLASLKLGTRIRLADGKEAEVTENPGDGMWVICRMLPDGDDPEVPVFAGDVVEALPADPLSN